MNPSLLLRILCLAGVLISGVMYFQIRNQKNRVETNLNQSRMALQRSEDEVSKLGASNRDLQRQVNTLTASVPPQNWREQQNRLQSRLLQLEAENTSLKRSLASAGQTQASVTGSATPHSNFQSTGSQSLGEVIRIGPDGSFAIISYGRILGASEGQTLAIYRDQQQVALVRLTQITNDFSIAQILSSINTGNSLSVPDIQIRDTAHLQSSLLP